MVFSSTESTQWSRQNVHINCSSDSCKLQHVNAPERKTYGCVSRISSFFREKYIIID